MAIQHLRMLNLCMHPVVNHIIRDKAHSCQSSYSPFSHVCLLLTLNKCLHVWILTFMWQNNIGVTCLLQVDMPLYKYNAVFTFVVYSCARLILRPCTQEVCRHVEENEIDKKCKPCICQISVWINWSHNNNMDSYMVNQLLPILTMSIWKVYNVRPDQINYTVSHSTNLRFGTRV